MTLQFWFWLVIFFWLAFGLWRNWGTAPEVPYLIGGHLLQFILFAIVGWQVFRAPVK